MPGHKDAKKAAGMRPEVSAAAAAVDDLRKRIAAEADIIVNETMPKKVLRPRLRFLLPGAHCEQARTETSLVQVAELTKIIEESELFKYPEQDDFIGQVGSSP